MATCVFFCPTDTWGGVEKNVRLRAEHLGKRGHNIYVVVLKDKFTERFSGLKNVEVISVNQRGGDINVFVIRNYFKILKNLQADAVFSALKKDWFLVAMAAYLAKVPKTILYLGIKRKIRQGVKYRTVFNRLKAKVLVNSDSLKNHLLESTPFFDENNLFRIYNGFPIPGDGEKLNLKEKLNLAEDVKIIGCVGRFSPQKGYDLLPDILENLPENYHVVHAGEGPFEEEIKNKIENSSMAHRIHFLGQMSPVHPFYRVMDVFLLCSRWEGMANVLNEAMSHGVPVVSTRVSGSEELLQNGTYGILTEIEDTKAMADGLHQILTQKKQFPKEHLIQRIRQDFSLEQMIDNTEKLLFD